MPASPQISRSTPYNAGKPIGAASKHGAVRPVTRSDRRRSRIVVKYVVGLLLIGAAVAGAVYWQSWPTDLCRQCELRVAAAPDEAVPDALRQLDSLGPRGLTAMVRFLNAPRVAARRASLERLSARLDGLDLANSTAEHAALAAIAEGLEQLTATNGAEMHAETVAFAWELLEAVGTLSLDEQISPQDRGRLLVACDQILQRPTPAVPAPSATTQLSWTMPVGNGPTTSNPGPKVDPGPPRKQGFPDPNSSPVSIAAPRSANAQPVPATTPSAPSPLTLEATSPRSAANAAARVNPIRGPQSDVNVRPASIEPASQAVAPLAPLPDARPLNIQARTAWDLFADLRNAGNAHASVAEAELTRRGFTPREIELGRHLTSPDDAERRRYTESLPSMSGVAIRPWLLHLCHDPSADVRLAAAAIMGTTNDPALLARLRELGLADSDERVRFQAQRAINAPKSR